MPDDLRDILRDRISAIMEAHDVNSDCRCPGPITNWFDHMADAVVRELGLRREGNESRTVTNEQGATYRIEGGHRYVTDWKSDE